MTILTPPGNTRFLRSRFDIANRTGFFAGTFEPAGETIETPLGLWIASITGPKIKGAELRAWQGFFRQLRGRAGRFYLGDPDHMTPRGTAGGSPLVDGGAQTGNTLLLKGAGLSEPLWLGAGDYFHFDTPTGKRELHALTADAASDGTGAVTVTFEPPLRESPAADAVIVTTNPTAVMMLTADDEGLIETDQVGASAVAFEAIEQPE